MRSTLFIAAATGLCVDFIGVNRRRFRGIIMISRRMTCLIVAPLIMLAACKEPTTEPIVPVSPPGAPARTISVSGVANITNAPRDQDHPLVSGNYVLWLDNPPYASIGNLGDIFACDVSSGLDACASGRVPAVNLTAGVGVYQWVPAAGGNFLVWITGDVGTLVGCSLAAGLDQCKQSPTVLRAGGLVGPWPQQSVLGAPVVNDHVVAWTEAGHAYGCDISGGLQNCVTTTAQLSPDNQAPDMLTVGASHVFWDYPIGVTGVDIAGCDFSQGLSHCIQTPTNFTFTSGVGRSNAFASGSVLVWAEVPVQGPTYSVSIYGCNVPSGAVDCSSPPVHIGFSYPFALDGRVLVFEGGPTFLSACDIGSGLDNCASTAVGLAAELKVFPSVTVSGALVAWTGFGSGTGMDIFGMRLTLSGPPPTLTQIVLTPATVVLPAGGTQQFTAEGRLSDGSITSVSVTYSATGGTITSGGLYTAGQIAGNYQVTATQQGGTLAGSADVTVTAPTLTQIVLTPATVVLPAGGTQQFTAAGRLSDGSITSVSVTYSAAGGTITTGGLYTAGQIAGNYQVTATQQGGMLAARADVAITAPAVAFSVTPLQEDFGDVSKNGSTMRSFTVRNDGSGAIVGLIGATAPFSPDGSGTFAVNVGSSQSVQIRFAPPTQGLYKGAGIFTVGQVRQTVTLIGERFDDCRKFFADWKWPWNNLTSCDLLNRLRDVNRFGIERYDPTTGLIATNTELFQYIQHHRSDVEAVVLQVDYGQTIANFVDNLVCMGPANSQWVTLLERAVGVKDVYDKIALALQIANDNLSATVGGLAVNISLMQATIGVELIQDIKCKAQLEVSQVLKLYFDDRKTMSKEDAFSDATTSLGLRTDFIGARLSIPPAAVGAYFAVAYDAYRLAGDSELRKGIGRGIAARAVAEGPQPR